MEALRNKLVRSILTIQIKSQMKALFIILFVTVLMSFNNSLSQAGVQQRNEETPVKGITPARARSLVGVVVGIVSIIIGVRGKRRSNRSFSFFAIGMGSLAIILGIVHLSTVSGDFGTGGGKAGALGALILGTVGGFFGVLTLMKLKRSAS